VILTGAVAENDALRMLILRMNTLQRAILFEILPCIDRIPLLELACQKTVKTADVEAALKGFHDIYNQLLAAYSKEYRCSIESPRNGFVVLSQAIEEKHYYLRAGEKTVFIALGDWRKHMAPPSIVEFMLALVVASAGVFFDGAQPRPRHFGTRGCIFDFAADLADARYRVLYGFICHDCQAALRHRGASDEVIAALTVLARRDWLLEPTNALSPASMASALGYDLFITKGIKPTLRERVRVILAEEGTKQFIQLVFAVLLAGLLIWLGLKGR
jgi:hypothetical protein